MPFLVLALGLAGCGGAKTGSSGQIARIDALSRTICGQRAAAKASSKATEKSQLRAQARRNVRRLFVLLKADRTDPRVATFEADVYARAVLRTRLRQRTGSFRNAEGATAGIAEAFRYDRKIYQDEKALGLPSCLAKAPRKPIEG